MGLFIAMETYAQYAHGLIWACL